MSLHLKAFLFSKCLVRRCRAAPRRRLARLVGPLSIAVLVATNLSVARAQDAPGDPVAFRDLPGFAEDDLGAAMRAFRASCAALVGSVAPLRAAAPVPAGLGVICESPAASGPAAVRAFLERHFEPRKIDGAAFFTGYYEPVVAGSPAPTPDFPTPLYAPPVGLVSIAPGTTPGLDPALTAAWREPNGRLAAMPDRAAIEAGALGAAARPLVYVRGPVEAFFIQVQGSARIRLPGGTLRRLVYAGRNGYPYTSIGKLLVARLGVPPSEMGMAQLKAWIRANGEGPHEAGGALMQANRSYIFFRFDASLSAEAGPIGGEGVSLTPGRSLAIDRTRYPYGLPFYVATTLPDGTPFHRLMVAQDTGAAIVGAGRADVFFGTGDAAAAAAGAMRQPGTLYVLWPKVGVGR